MLKRSTKWIVFALALIFSQCALEQVSPADYNDAIFVQQMKVKNLITDLTKAPDDRVRGEVLEELRIQTLNSLENVKEIGPFRGDDQLLIAAIPLFEFYIKLAHETLDCPIDEVPGRLDASIQDQVNYEQDFFKAQGVFAEEYELFL